MSDRQKLLSIIAHARSGAVDYAWRMLLESGFDRINDDHAVLSVVGRLLKDKALASTGNARRQLYKEASTTYARAAKISRSTYPLINAATLSLLAGDSDSAKELAKQVLTLIQSGQDEGETPYYREATRAEALLLLGDVSGAKTALGGAIALASRAFEDHASTLRQFGLILDQLHEDQTWLDPLRPPRCLHFAGHMGVGMENTALQEEVRSLLRQERVGFGFGALAAGADLVIAEALMEAGAELHIILPADPERFREVSVVPFGPQWAAKFDRILGAVESIRSVEANQAPTSPQQLQLAAEVAMGSAVMHANTLMTEALQLVLLDEPQPTECEPGSSQWVSSAWHKAGRRQRVIAVPREKGESLSLGTKGDAETCGLVAMLRVECPDADINALMKEVLPQLVSIVSSAPATPIAPRWTGETLSLAYSRPSDAVKIAQAISSGLARTADICVAGHYGIATYATDPFDGAALLSGPAAVIPHRIIPSAPPGAIHITEDFAAALHAGPAGDCPRTAYIGELPAVGDGSLIRLFSVSR